VSTDGLVVVDSLFRLPAGVRGVAVLAQVPDVKPIDATAAVSVEDHALTRDIDWRAAAVGARAPGPPGDGWLPLVSARGGVLLAVRESPVRQVWVGLASDAFARTPDFVILWTRTFDWLGGGASTFTSQPVGSIGSDEVVPQDAALWPGLVRTRTGRLVALNAAPVNLAESVTTDARETQARINAVAPVDRWSVELRVALLLSSLGVLMFAWRSEVRSERRSLQFRARSEP